MTADTVSDWQERSRVCLCASVCVCYLFESSWPMWSVGLFQVSCLARPHNEVKHFTISVSCIKSNCLQKRGLDSLLRTAHIPHLSIRTCTLQTSGKRPAQVSSTQGQVAATFRHFALCPGIYLRKSIFKPSHIVTKMCDTLSVAWKTKVSQKGRKDLQVLEGGNGNIEVVSTW